MTNPNNPNNGNVGTQDVGSLLSAPDSKGNQNIQPAETSLQGKDFLAGSPAGREAQPKATRGSKPGYLR